MDVVIKIAQVVASFSLLVLVHELGHFLFAKMFGARVEKFYLFFNPWFSLVKFKIGETEYGIGWVPFGGYCKIAGMVDESTDADELGSEPQPWEYRSKPAWQRLLIIVGGVLMNILLAVAIYIGIMFKWGDSYIKTADVHDGFEFSQVAQDLGFRNGDKILSLDGRYVDNYRQIPIDILLDDVQTVTVDRAGTQVDVSMVNKDMKALLKDPSFMEVRRHYTVGAVLADSGAYRAGIQPGDSITGVNGVPLKWQDQIHAAISSHPGDTILLAYVRAGQPMETPVAVSPTGKIGILSAPVRLSDDYNISTQKYTFFQSIPVGTKRAFSSIGSYLKQLKLIVSPETEAYKSVGGIISMGKIFPNQWHWLSFWQVTALLSIMLAVLNILPIPMLDGGHMVFILYEMITRRKPSDKFMERAQLVGMIIVFGIIILANGNDILKLIFS